MITTPEDLTASERSAVLRSVRRSIEQMQDERRVVHDRATRGDQGAEAIVVILDFEIGLLANATQKIWRGAL